MAGKELREIKIEVLETDRTPNVQETSQQKEKKLPKEKTRQAKYKQWLAGVTKKCRGHANHAKGGECCIFTVPKSLKGLKGKKAAYEPQIVSLGPFHFLENADLSFTEQIKSEVVGSIQDTKPNFFSKVVEEIKRNENWIRNCYDREKQLDSEILPWMMARDAYFILQFFRQPLFRRDIDKKYCIREIENLPLLPLMDVLKDIAKLGNQVPLSVLRTILLIENETGTSEDILNEQADKELNDMLKLICKNVSPINARDNFNLKEEKHILECLHSYVVGDTAKSTHDHGKFNFFDSFVYYIFRGFFCIIYGILNLCIWKRKDDEQTILPPAVELHKAGVKFRPSVDGIRGIRFVKKRCTLYLPEIKVDIHTETIMRNIVAFELCSSGCKDKAPVTRYIHLMDQLVNTDKDAAVLRKSNIIYDKLENDSKMTDLWNSLTDSTAVPRYDPIDDATEGLKRYYQKRTTTSVIVCNEFVERHCSSPWQAFGLVASIVLLMITTCTTLADIFKLNNGLDGFKQALGAFNKTLSALPKPNKG